MLPSNRLQRTVRCTAHSRSRSQGSAGVTNVSVIRTRLSAKVYSVRVGWTAIESAALVRRGRSRALLPTAGAAPFQQFPPTA